MAENAEAGAGDGLELGLALRPSRSYAREPRKVKWPGRQPGEQLAGLGFLRAGVGEPFDQVPGDRPHRRWSSIAPRRSSRTRRRSAARPAGSSGGRPRRGSRTRDRVRVRVGPDRHRLAGAVRGPGHVPAHGKQRVHDQADVGVVPVELHRDRVDQVGHVVGDDVDEVPAPVSEASARPDADRRPALRAGARRAPHAPGRAPAGPGPRRSGPRRRPAGSRRQGSRAGRPPPGPGRPAARAPSAAPPRSLRVAWPPGPGPTAPPPWRAVPPWCRPGPHGLSRAFRHCLSTPS